MNFQRLLEFCSTADASTPPNDIRVRLPNALKTNPDVFQPYEKSIQRLDVSAWDQVKEKLLDRTIKYQIHGWAQFFQTLAEVRGYCYLLDDGYSDVHFIQESESARTPDIEAVKPDGTICLLESKSIGFSVDERTYMLENTRKLNQGEAIDVRSVELGMPQGLKDKITSTITKAKEQLMSYRSGESSIRRLCILQYNLIYQCYWICVIMLKL